MIRGYALLTASFLFLSSAVSAQEPAPISVVSAGQNSKGDGLGELKLTNQSSKKILGYVLIYLPGNLQASGASRVVETRLTGLEPPPGRDGFAPGEVWRHRTGLNPQRISQSRVVIDYVMFADHSSWGANSAGKAERMKGLEDGWRESMALLKTILDEKGPTGVTELLSRVTP